MREIKVGEAYLLLSLTALAWGANAVFGRLAVGEVSPMTLVMLRWLGTFLLALLVARRSLPSAWPRLRERLVYLAIMGCLGFTAFNTVFYYAAHSTSAVNIGILQGAIPIFVLIGAYFADGTRIGFWQVLGLPVALLGVVMVATAGSLDRLFGLDFKRGDLLMILACLMHATYTVALSRRPQVPALALFAVMAGLALAVSLPLLAVEAAIGGFLWPSPKGWLLAGLVVIFPSFLAQIFYILGVVRIGPGRAGAFVNLVPVFASILAVLILEEPFEDFQMLALLLVLGGIFLSERGRAR